MFSQISEKLKYLKAQPGYFMYFSSYRPLKFTLKSAQNAKFPVNHTLRWNNSNQITTGSKITCENSKVENIWYNIKPRDFNQTFLQNSHFGEELIKKPIRNLFFL